MNFIENPELIGNTPNIAILSGLWVFQRKIHLYGIGNIDANTSVTRVSQAINGSDHKPPNGLTERKEAFEKAQSIIKECLNK